MQMQVAEDVRERWETSDNPVVQKIQEYDVLHHFFVLPGYKIWSSIYFSYQLAH